MSRTVIHFSYLQDETTEYYRSFIQALQRRYHVSYIQREQPFASTLTSTPCSQHGVPMGVASLEADANDPSVYLSSYIDMYHDEPVVGVGHGSGALLTYVASVCRPDLFRAMVLIDDVSFGCMQRLNTSTSDSKKSCLSKLWMWLSTIKRASEKEDIKKLFAQDHEMSQINGLTTASQRQPEVINASAKFIHQQDGNIRSFEAIKDKGKAEQTASHYPSYDVQNMRVKVVKHCISEMLQSRTFCESPLEEALFATLAQKCLLNQNYTLPVPSALIYSPSSASIGPYDIAWLQRYLGFNIHSVQPDEDSAFESGRKLRHPIKLVKAVQHALPLLI